MSRLSSNMPTTTSKIPTNTSSSLLNNQNLLHVKFHVNKIQENLLNKRLKQINDQEMKLRLKNQRTSNDLVNFLNDCKQSTGYFSKMNSNKSSSVSSLSLMDQQTSKLNIDNKQRNKYLDDQILKSNTNSSLDLNYIEPKSTKNVLSKPKLSRKFCFKSLDFDKNQQQVNNEIFRAITPLKSLPETAESFVDSTESENNNKLIGTTLFEQILSIPETNSSSTPTSTSNSSHNNMSSSKASASSRSTDSTCSSGDFQINNLKDHCSTKKFRPSSSSTIKSINSKYLRSKFSDSTTLSNIDWLSSTFTFDLDLDKNSTEKKGKNVNNQFVQNFSGRYAKNPNIKTNDQKKIRQNSFKKSEFKSRSLNLLLNTNELISFKPIETANESSLSSFLSNESNKSKLSMARSVDTKYQTKNSFANRQQAFPIQISMSRNLIRKKQLGLINDYKTLNSMEFIKSLRQIQENLDTKVKQFSYKTIQQIV
jgi:hypothetical protein